MSETDPTKDAEDTKPEEGETPAAEGSESKAEEPKAEEPKAEEPKAEEPKAEEPKAEEPKAEAPKAEAPKAEEPKAPAPVAAAKEAAPVAAEPLEHAGLLVEFETPDQLMQAAAKVRDAGFSDWDCHSPYPVHGLDKAMGIKPTILPWIAFFGGLTGCTVGFILQTYTNGPELPFSVYQSGNFLISEVLAPFLPSGYPFVTSGKPIVSTPANIPVMFELTILLSAFGAFFGMLGLNRLPRLHHPVFSSERFRRATSDRFFISIEASDPIYHRARAQAFCETLGGAAVEALEA
ncbi:MAG: DUF3341 domain-containing protein [Planctomycetes bacterium]|nr:DUF3341 domain-containing protein [Planctomycetota bacterium]